MILGEERIMFRNSQILSATRLIKHFRAIRGLLSREPQALLVTQRRGGNLVIVNAEIFEDLVNQSFIRRDEARNSS